MAELDSEGFWQAHVRRGGTIVADGCLYEDRGRRNATLTVTSDDRTVSPGATVVTYRHLATGEVVTTTDLVLVGEIPDSYLDLLPDTVQVLERRPRRPAERSQHGWLNLDALPPAPTYWAGVVFEAEPLVAAAAANQFLALRVPWPQIRIRHQPRRGPANEWLILTADDAYQYFGVGDDLEPGIQTGDQIVISDPTTTWTTEARALAWSSRRTTLAIEVTPPVERPGPRFSHLRWRLAELGPPPEVRQRRLPPETHRVAHSRYEVYHVTRPEPRYQDWGSDHILGQVIRSVEGPDRDYEVYYRYPTDRGAIYVGPPTLDYFGHTPDLATAAWALARLDLGVRAGLRTVVVEDLDLVAGAPQLGSIGRRLVTDLHPSARPRLRSRSEPVRRAIDGPPSP